MYKPLLLKYILFRVNSQLAEGRTKAAAIMPQPVELKLFALCKCVFD